MDKSDLRRTLLAYIEDNFDVEGIGDDTPLFSSNLLDSFSMVELVTFVEREMNIRIGAMDIHLDNLDSVERIVVFIQQRTA
jgi:acyl carrier protein